MSSRAKPFLGSNRACWIRTRHCVFGSIVATLALHVAACSGDIQDTRTTSASSTGNGSSTASSSGVGAGGGSGGSGGAGGGNASGGAAGMGSGGAPADGGTGSEYVAYHLFTHVPRFVVYKIDHTRNLCFRITVAGFSSGGQLSIDVTDPWAAEHAEVTNNIADCTVSGGFPPQPQMSANATTGAGTIVVRGQFPCEVDVHATLSFEPVGPWVPMSESFDVDMLPVDGGCG